MLTHTYETRAQLAKARTVYDKFGGSYVRYMREIGLLTHRTTLVHGVYLTRPEVDQLAEAGAGVVHNPIVESETQERRRTADRLQARRRQPGAGL